MVLAAKSPAAPKTAAVSAQVANILDAIKNTTTPVAAADVVAAAGAAKKPAAKKPKQPTVPRGVAKSGRPWKEVKQKYVRIGSQVHIRA